MSLLYQILVVLCLLIPAQSLLAAEICKNSAKALQLIEAVDDVFYAETRESVATMHIQKGSRTRTVKMHSYVQGNEKSFTEVFAPARDKGSKFLKLGNQMWIYTPDADKIIKIAGHMLRKGMLGSDMSYEDALEDRKLQELYTICWLDEKDPDWPGDAVIELTAIVKDLTYYRRKLMIDPQSKLMHKEERFARSGKKLKILTIDEYAKTENGKPYAKKVTITDLLRRDSQTVMTTDEIKLDHILPENLFSKQSLRR